MLRQFRLREHLNHEWADELVGFPWEGRTCPWVTGPDGRELPAQLSGGKVWFVVDRLPALGSAEFQAEGEAAARTPCASAAREGDAMVLSNGRIGLRVPASQSCAAAAGSEEQALPGPLLGIRHGDGPWIGRGVLRASPDQAISEIRFETVEEGPLWCAYAVRYLAGDKEYRVAYRLDAGAARVQIAEHSLLCHDARWEFDIHPGFEPRRAAYGHHSTQGRTRIIDLEFSGRQHLGDVQAPDQPTHFFRDDFDVYAFLNDRLALGLCAVRDGDWTCLSQNSISMLPGAGPSLLWRATCKAGKRVWLAYFGDAGDHVAEGDWTATPGGRLRREYETTLDWVKDLVLEWEEEPAGPRPYAACTREDLERAQRLFRDWEPLKRYGEFLDRDAELAQGQYDSHGHYPLDENRREDPMCAWLMRPDPAVADKLKRGLIEGLRRRVDIFLGPHGHRGYVVGAIDMGRTLRPFAQMYDILAPHLEMSEPERRYLRAAFAFLASKAADRHYWNAEAIVLHSDHPKSSHRTAWFPSRESDWATYNVDTAPHNFHIDLYTGLGAIALAFPGHPCSRDWVDRTLSYIERELDTYVFPTGAFIESATYTLAVMHWWVPYFAMLRNARIRNYFLDERFQRMGRCLARVVGPYDRRLRRHSFTVMGDANYPSGGGDTLAWVACLGREDAEFSAVMMGAWEDTGRQLNNPGQQGLSMYDALFIDPSLPAKPLRGLTSEHVNGLGLILRSGHGTEDEVYFFIKCGKIYSHFHHDEGAFFAFADQVPILDEYGVQYGTGTDEAGRPLPVHAPRCHNGISFTDVPTDREAYNRGFVTRFLTQEYADYAVCEMPVHLLYMKPGLSTWGFQGEEAPYGWWRRHILFVKPHGFFFYDELESEFAAALDLNFKADRYETRGGLSRIYRGRYGTDIPVCVNLPAGAAARDGRMEIEGTTTSFAKFSSMEAVDPEMKRTFYHQAYMHVPAPAGTDFSWAFGWARPEAQATFAPLPGGSPGSVLTLNGGAVRALVAPWLRRAVRHEDAAVVYEGWAGAVVERPDGGIELIQMNGNVVGRPGGVTVEGDGPFRATVRDGRVELETDGRARWITVRGVRPGEVASDGRVRRETAGGEERWRRRRSAF
jgi:hypothetical protein